MRHLCSRSFYPKPTEVLDKKERQKSVDFRNEDPLVFVAFFEIIRRMISKNGRFFVRHAKHRFDEKTSARGLGAAPQKRNAKASSKKAKTESFSSFLCDAKRTSGGRSPFRCGVKGKQFPWRV